LGLSGLSVSFLHINFALLKSGNDVNIQVQNDFSGEKIRASACCCTGGEKGHLRRDAVSLKIGCTAQDAVT